jgi:hypothetical protein
LQVEHKDREIEQSGQIEVEESDAYSLFLYAVRSSVTRDYYLRRLRIFLNHIGLLPAGTMEERCNLYVLRGKTENLRNLCRRLSFHHFLYFKTLYYKKGAI